MRATDENEVCSRIQDLPRSGVWGRMAIAVRN